MRIGLRPQDLVGAVTKKYSAFGGKSHGVVVAMDSTRDKSLVARTNRPFHSSENDFLSEYLAFSSSISRFYRTSGYYKKISFFAVLLMFIEHDKP